MKSKSSRFRLPNDTTEESSGSDESRNEDAVHARRSLADTSGSFTQPDPNRKRSQSSDRYLGPDQTVKYPHPFSAEEVETWHHELEAGTNLLPKKQSRHSDLVPKVELPRPAPAPLLPSPTSSPSVLSPTSARNRQIQIHVTGAEELIDIAGTPTGSSSKPRSNKTGPT